MNERAIRVDSRRLDVALAASGIRTDRELSAKSGVDERTIRNVRRLGTCTFKVLNSLASTIGCNPIDLLVTPGHPDPKIGVPGHPISLKEMGRA